LRKVITIRSWAEFSVQINNLGRGIYSGIDKALALEEMVMMAKVFCPVDTGALMESIRAERLGPYETALVAGGADYINPKTGKTVDYAVYVHEGTSRMPARPCLQMAVEREKFNVAKKVLVESFEEVE